MPRFVSQWMPWNFFWPAPLFSDGLTRELAEAPPKIDGVSAPVGITEDPDLLLRREAFALPGLGSLFLARTNSSPSLKKAIQSLLKTRQNRAKASLTVMARAKRDDMTGFFLNGGAWSTGHSPPRSLFPPGQGARRAGSPRPYSRRPSPICHGFQVRGRAASEKSVSSSVRLGL